MNAEKFYVSYSVKKGTHTFPISLKALKKFTFNTPIHIIYFDINNQLQKRMVYKSKLHN